MLEKSEAQEILTSVEVYKALLPDVNVAGIPDYVILGWAAMESQSLKERCAIIAFDNRPSGRLSWEKVWNLIRKAANEE